MFSPFVDLLLLVLVANGTPLLANKLLNGRFPLALDFGHLLADQQPILGPAKTWRGLLASLLITSLCAWIIGYPPITGIWISLLCMLGDSSSSFIKRRLGKPSSSSVPLLDQIPESLIPAMLMADRFALEIASVFYLVLIFTVIDLVSSRLMAQLRVGRRSA